MNADGCDPSDGNRSTKAVCLNTKKSNRKDDEAYRKDDEA